MSVTLEDLYNGTTRKLAVQKNVICVKCEGRGGKKGSVEKCVPCRGSGMETKIQQIAPGLVQQFDQVCRSCRGQGEIIPAKDRCKNCDGRKITRDRKILEVHVDKGMRDGQKICFAGEGDQEPGLEPGDILIVLDEKPHPEYKRSNNDLILKMPLQLVESLCGFQKVVRTLDSRDLVITHLPGEVIKSDSIKFVRNEGMPIPKNPMEKGRLIISFVVKYPDFIQPEVLPILEQCFPPRPTVIIPQGPIEEVMLVDLDPGEKSQNRRGQEVYEEDDDYHGHEQRGPQCTTT